MSAARYLLAVFGIAFAGVAGCDDPIQRGWLVDRSRLLGARIEATNDPARATVAPSEKATVKWLLASPRGAAAKERVSFAYAICASPTGNFPSPKCEGPVLGSGSGNTTADDDGLVAIEIDAPPGAAVGDAKELLMLSAFCVDETPSTIALDARSFEATCSVATAKTLLGSVNLHVRPAPGAAETDNDNPAIDTGDILLDGQVLGAPRACTPDVPVILSNAGERTLVFHFHDEQRQIASTPQNTRESLVLSHVVTAGELDRQYSALDPEEPAPKDVEIKWTPPGAEEVPADGTSRLVDILFILRDGRGGTAFARRAVCVKRP